MPLEVIGKELIDTTINIIKENNCPSLSGKSILTYNIVVTPESNILIRLDKSSGNGKFSREWVSLNSILSQIQGRDKPFTWSVLSPLFKAQSVNTSGFLLAALKSEGLVRAIDQGYEAVDPAVFKKRIKGLSGKKSKPRKARRTSTTSKRSVA